MLFFLSVVLNAQASPVEPAVAAEQVRLSDELRRLAGRQAWLGVDRTYRELTAMHAPLGREEHLQAAHAARALGDVAGTYARLTEAFRLGESRELADWMWAIDTGYGRVELVGDATALSTLEPMLDPDQRAAIGFAASRIEAEGRFVGLLPAGTYSFGDATIHVEAGRLARAVATPTRMARRR